LFHLDNALCNLLKYFIDAITCFGRRLLIYNVFINIQAHLHFLFALGCNLPLISIYIALIARQRDNKVTHIVLLLHLVGPEADALETALVRDVVTNERGDGIPIIHAYETAKTVWAASVPDVHFHHWAILNCHILLHVSTTNCDVIVLTEVVLTVTLRYTWLSDAGITQQHYFCLNYCLRLYCVFFVVLEAHRPAASATSCTLAATLPSSPTHFEDLITLILWLLLFTAAASRFILGFLTIKFAATSFRLHVF
jgi:hypothetical protein